MRKTIGLLLAALFCAGLAFAGGNQARSSGVTFAVALSEDIRALDPGVAWNYITNQVTNQITESLVTLDANDNVIPELAKSWHQADDLTYVYEVRDNVFFSDGTRMTMDDVVFSLNRYKDPDGGTFFSEFYQDVESISATGLWQLTIKLTQPSAVFKFIPAIGAGRIISKAYYEKHADDFGTAKGGIVATGPFVYQSWTSGQEIVLKKNPNYWNKEKLAANIVDTIVFKVIPDDTTRVIALQTGSVDFSVNIPEAMVGQLASDRNVTVTFSESYHLTHLSMNTQRPPFSDVNVRRAVSHALNLAEFQRTIIKDSGTVGTVLPFGPAMYGENAISWRQYIASAPGYDYDLAKARQFLAQSAYPQGFSCVLITSENSLVGQRALFLQEALKALNINVEIKKMSGDEQDVYQLGEVLDKNGKRDYDILFGGLEADYPDVNGLIELFFASDYVEGGYNSAAYSNPIVDGLINKQRSTTENAKRFDIQKQLVDIVVNDVPYIVFDYSKRHSALSNKYTGIAVTPAWQWVLPIQDLRLAKQ